MLIHFKWSEFSLNSYPKVLKYFTSKASRGNCQKPSVPAPVTIYDSSRDCDEKMLLNDFLSTCTKLELMIAEFWGEKGQYENGNRCLFVYVITKAKLEGRKGLRRSGCYLVFRIVQQTNLIWRWNFIILNSSETLNIPIFTLSPFTSQQSLLIQNWFFGISILIQIRKILGKMKC